MLPKEMNDIFFQKTGAFILVLKLEDTVKCCVC